ncbi:MAG: CPBP family intramembrane metalloprotease [Ardenticatenia bacterium]|nr:CPBP family intramembrane metalloprotease [Ardenticatenia bacterium]
MQRSPELAKPPWTYWEAALVVGLTLVTVWGGLWLGALVVRGLLPNPSPVMMVLVLGMGESALVAPVIWLARRHRVGWHVVGWRHPAGGWWETAKAIGQAMVWGYAAMLAWGLILLPLGLRAQQNILAALPQDDPLALGLMVLVVVGVAPVCEELLFRGLIFTTLNAYHRPRTAYGLSALLFALFHFQPLAFPPLLVLGLLLAHLYRRTGSVWSPVVFHALINGFTFLVWVVEVFFPQG